MKEKDVRVGISQFPPFIMKKNGGYEGFEIELWNKVARELNFKSHFHEYEFQELIPLIQEGKIDVAVSGMAITREREKLIDFTHSTFDSGLRIMVSNKTVASVIALLRSLFRRETLQAVAVLICFMFIAANLVWIAERNGGGSLDSTYFPGIFNALWWAVVSVTSIGYGDYIPITFFGRILAALIIFAGLGIFGVYIAEVSSSLTMRKLRSGIENQHDLFGKRVATLEGSYAEDATRNLGADVLVTRKIEEAYKKLLNDEVLAVVFDEPVLLYFASHEGKDKVKLVGDLFHPQNYGFAISEGSEMREPINQALLKIIETGEYNILYKKWFGVEL